jgi:hypothetical protein
MAHTCNPSYLGGGDQEDRGSSPTGQRVNEAPPLQSISQEWWSNMGAISRITVPGWPGKNVRPYFEK